jgi:hypothetical protein
MSKPQEQQPQTEQSKSGAVNSGNIASPMGPQGKPNGSQPSISSTLSSRQSSNNPLGFGQLDESRFADAFERSTKKSGESWDDKIKRFVNESTSQADQVKNDVTDDQLRSAGNMLGSILTPRRIYSRINGILLKNNVAETAGLCKNSEDGICTLLKAVVEGKQTRKTLNELTKMLSDDELVEQLEAASSDEILALRKALQMNNETYQEWVQKIRNNPEKYGFPETRARQTSSDAASGQPQNKSAAAADAAAIVQNAIGGITGATSTSTNSNSNSSSSKYLKQRGGANEELDRFLNNHNLQYFIMTFFQFLKVNPALLSDQSQQPVVRHANSRTVSNFSGGSIIDTILNTSRTIQRGGSDYDIRRIENILNNPINLYSNQLRSLVNQLKNKMKSVNKDMDAPSSAALEEAIARIGRVETSVLTTTLLGHKLLEAHRNYSNIDEVANASNTLEKLKQVAALVEQKSDKLKKRNEQVAQTIQLIMQAYPTLAYSVSPMGPR